MLFLTSEIITTVDNLINENIKNHQIRILDQENKTSKLTTKNYALREAQDNGADLVEINTQDDTSICIIVDYSKFKYEQKKKLKEQNKINRQNHVETKEIQLRPVTDINDIKIKAKRAQEFIDSGNKVRVIVKFRGREMSHIDMGKEVMNNFLNNISGFKYDSEPKLNGKDLLAVLAKDKIEAI